MSFGFSVGDFISVFQLANKVRKEFVGAPNQFKDISDEVRSLSIVLHDVDICLSRCEISDEQETHQARRAWKRLQWEPEDIHELRDRITANIILLNTFLGGISGYYHEAGADRLNRYREDEERRRISDWFTPTKLLEFLLAQIYLRSLGDKPTTKTVRNALLQFQGQSRVSASEDSRVMILSRAYDQAMERINGQMAGFRDLTKRVLSWIACSKRPLTVMGLRYALAVEIGELELDEETLLEAEDMVSVYAGFVTVDDGSDTIRLVHYTAQEYFERTLKFYKAPDAFLGIIAFASCWPKVGSASQVLVTLRSWWGYIRKVPGMTELHLALFFELTSILRALLEGGYESNPKDAYGWTSLIWAATCGRDAVVEALLSTDGADPNHKDNDGKMHWPWRQEMVTDNDKITPLWLAVLCGNDAVVAALLGTGHVNADFKQFRGRMPLSYAATTGQEGVLELVLAAGVDPDGPGWTPLPRAAEQGHDFVVEHLLVTNNVDCNVMDGHSRTPLIYATVSGHKRVTKLLLSAGGVRVNSKDNQGRTPICWAARNDHDEIVKMILTTGLADPTIEDNDGFTPLSLARATVTRRP
ncbi:hypothetical protein E0Z10_g9452 [Xylaria hypoxylon]|uniref:GPI inositol-deacylase winged helix domain-containing protein n=1 Tax=Xylaria hypoxylon TaxID=37992 RepID=A0A4Z0YKE0_9PEZI|nr:hypothetical protein E0Z10_g9452 [Xylaria hypoxylon]